MKLATMESVNALTDTLMKVMFLTTHLPLAFSDARHRLRWRQKRRLLSSYPLQSQFPILLQFNSFLAISFYLVFILFYLMVVVSYKPRKDYHRWHPTIELQSQRIALRTQPTQLIQQKCIPMCDPEVHEEKLESNEPRVFTRHCH